MDFYHMESPSTCGHWHRGVLVHRAFIELGDSSGHNNSGKRRFIGISISEGIRCLKV